mgnify:FL=1|jgi:DNA-binding transcriptional regulator YiaG
MKRYPDCEREDENCAACALANYNRDCHNNPISNLAYYRGVTGLSQSQLAEKAGISTRTLQDYEQGRKPLDRAAAATVKRLAKALGVSVEDLI